MAWITVAKSTCKQKGHSLLDIAGTSSSKNHMRTSNIQEAMTLCWNAQEHFFRGGGGGGICNGILILLVLSLNGSAFRHFFF